MFWFLHRLSETSVFNLMRYVTVRGVLAAGFAFFVSVVLGPRLILWLRRRRIGEETTKTDSEKLNNLHGGKNGTPTMGGLMIVWSTLIASLLFARLVMPVVTLMLVLCGMAAIGFADDWIKLKSTRKGMRGRTKFLLQWVVGFAAGVVLYATLCVEAPHTGVAGGSPASAVFFPFLKHWYLYLGVGFVVFVAFVVVGFSNAVNLTDGLDGLAAGSAVFCAGAMTVAAYLAGHKELAEYLFIPYVAGAGEVAVVMAALCGALLGFLWFNCYPAKVFMGDTGALAVGGVLGAAAVATKQEAVLLFAGLVFVVETISVMLQVLSFKLTGKRIFRIAPLHHHFEFSGQHENAVTVRFWIVAAFCALFALATLKVR